MVNFDEFTTIKNEKFEGRRGWLPRLDKIRLGIKKVSSKGKEYPAEVDYFVLPDRLKGVLGDEPKEIQIMFPTSDRSKVFPYAYKYYGSSQGLKCIGNGVVAIERQEDRSWKEGKTCPCDLLGKGCGQRGHLQFMVLSAGLGGVYQIDTGSEVSITGLNSDFDYIESLLGRIHLLPLTLRRIPTETHNEGKKQTHYTLQVEINATMDEIGQMRAHPSMLFKRNSTGAIEPVKADYNQYVLPPAEDINPALDPGGVVVYEEQECETGVKIDSTRIGKPLPEGDVPIDVGGPPRILITAEEFATYDKPTMIGTITSLQQELKIPDLPTPIPLNNCSKAELKQIYSSLLAGVVTLETIGNKE